MTNGVEQPEPTITIDGVEHPVNDLTEEHRTVIGHVQVADQEIAK